jgi:hypothetical protein
VADGDDTQHSCDDDACEKAQGQQQDGL